MELKQTVAQNVRLAREQSNMTQTELARRLGLASHSAVSDIESGNRRISASELGTMADVFGKPIDWFFDPQAGEEDFIALARATDAPAGVKAALREVQRLFGNYLVLDRLLRT